MNFLGFIAFLAVTFVIAGFIAFIGVVPLVMVAQLTQFDAFQIRWLCIATVVCCALLAIPSIRRNPSSATLELDGVILFGLVALFAAIWFQDIGPGAVWGHFKVTYQIDNFAMELQFAFAFIVAGLIGMLVSSGYQLPKKSV